MPSRCQAITFGAISLLLGAACSSDSPTELQDTPGLAIVSGNAQSGIAGLDLEEPLIIQVTTDAGEPIAGEAVTWRVTTGGGSVAPGPLMTDEDGEAESEWRLGSELGEQTITVTAAGRTRVFRATAVDTRNPTTIVAVNGENQTGTTGTQLLNPLVVRVENEFGRPIAGLEVEWSVESGGGLLNPATSTTDVDGHAQAQWTLGFSTSQQTAVAGVGGIRARFRATGRSSALQGP